MKSYICVHRLAPCNASPRSILQPVFPEDLHPATSAQNPFPLAPLYPLYPVAYLLILRTFGYPNAAGGVDPGTQFF